jgi:hypothetical protein
MGEERRRSNVRDMLRIVGDQGPCAESTRPGSSEGSSQKEPPSLVDPLECEALPARRAIQTWHGDKKLPQVQEVGVTFSCPACGTLFEEWDPAIFEHLAKGGMAEGPCKKCKAPLTIVPKRQPVVTLATNAEASAAVAKWRAAQAMKGPDKA